MSEKIVVVGFGRVGQANGIALRSMGNAVFSFDPHPISLHYADAYTAIYSRIQALSDIRAEDSDRTTYLVCISDVVLSNGTQDVTAIRHTLEKLTNVNGTVVLRSTVLPEHLAGFPRFDFYLPEFLHERRAVEQSLHPVRIVIGANSQKEYPQFIKSWIQTSERVFVGTPLEAAYIKYLSNIWNATRVALINEFGSSVVENFAGHAGGIHGVLDFILDNKDYQRFGRAYAGRCLPKDVTSYLKSAQASGHPMLVLEAVAKANELHRVAPDHDSLPEWFSAE